MSFAIQYLDLNKLDYISTLVINQELPVMLEGFFKHSSALPQEL